MNTEIWSVTIELAGGYPTPYLFTSELEADAFYKKMTAHYEKVDSETWVMWGGKHVVYTNHEEAINSELDGEPLQTENLEKEDDE